jgi:glyoxylase-like metal-dependent hydrolase (beta-lactamase superfamily II)
MQRETGLTYPFPQYPALGEALDVAPGVKWIRLKLPFQLNHINIYLIEDNGGWMVLDTGLDTDDCRAGWDAVLSGPLKGIRLSRMLVTHFHPDHVGLANWLHERFGLELTMPRTEYLFSVTARMGSGDMTGEAHRSFYHTHGLSREHTDAVLGRGHHYLSLTTGVPSRYTRVKDGDVLGVGGRDFQMATAGGHALEQAMLHRGADRLFFAADQVIALISPNVGVHPMEPDEDPLRAYLESLRLLRATIADDVLVLPGHGLPFYGLHARVDELLTHHEQRCGAILAACKDKPLSVAELVPCLFDRALDSHQTGFAFGEVLAHVNTMLGRAELALGDDAGGVKRWRGR